MFYIYMFNEENINNVIMQNMNNILMIINMLTPQITQKNLLI